MTDSFVHSSTVHGETKTNAPPLSGKEKEHVLFSGDNVGTEK